MTERTRFTTVGSIQPYYRPKKLEQNKAVPSFPWIRMQRHWFEQAGFEIGTRMQIKVELEQLMITKMEG